MGFVNFIDPIVLETVSIDNDTQTIEFKDSLEDQTGIIW